MSEANIDQKKFWSGKGGDVWVKRQQAMDTMLRPLGEAALQKLELNEDTNVLDIGCGCGNTTLSIAEKIKMPPTSGVLDLCNFLTLSGLSYKLINFDILYMK